jgi:hypothetical protein
MRGAGHGCKALTRRAYNRNIGDFGKLNLALIFER